MLGIQMRWQLILRDDKTLLKFKRKCISVAKKFDIKIFYHCMLIYMREAIKYSKRRVIERSK
jgi:hypothetical protein